MTARNQKIEETTEMRYRIFHWILFVVVALATGCATQEYARAVSPEIVSATRWGATPANEALARRHVISHITLHHQGLAFPRGKDPQQYLRDLQSWSRKSKQWIDVPYHYVIDLDGLIYEGRDIRFAGDTNTAYDPAGHALIEVVGNFEEVEPNRAQLAAVADLMALLVRRYAVPVENIRGHRDVAPGTECPGKNLYRYLENGFFHAEVRARMLR